MNKLRLVIIILIVHVLIFAAQCLYTVKPYQDVVQLRFGKIVRPCRLLAHYNLYLKWPSFIDKYIPIDKRLQVTDAVLETISTSDSKDQNLQVSAACTGFWRVTDADKFYTALLSQYKDSEPQAAGSYPEKVNDQIRSIIRSSVNNVFGQANLSELFGLPEFTGRIKRDCLSIDGLNLLPMGLPIRGGEIKRTVEEEVWIVNPDGSIPQMPQDQPDRVPCIVITLYGYDRELPVSAEDAPRQTSGRSFWRLKPDPSAAEGLDREELTLTIPLKYIDEQQTKETVQIERIQQAITRQVSAQTSAQFGVVALSVEVRRLSFPASNIAKVYEKMKSERNTVAEAYISSGKREAEIIRSRATYFASIEVSQAQGRARAMRGQAEAEAAKIAAETQNLNPEFYNWLQSLETAAEILKNKAWVVLSVDQPVIKTLLGQKPLGSESSEKSPNKNN